MKIYIQPVDKKFQPEGIPQVYPRYNSQYGVEQDIVAYLEKSNLLVSNKNEADWIYLPIFWTRWHINNDYGKNNLDILKNYIYSLNLDFKKVFTVCQYDDGPIVDLQDAKIFLSSRKTKEGIDIPLLATPFSISTKWEDKILFASFSGRIFTHPFRSRMAKSLSGYPNAKLYNGDYGTEHFTNLMSKSKIALCPRGYGGGSFRFYEAMQFGAIPLLIGDIDTRPFKKYIDWDSCSFYLENPDKAREFLERIDTSKLEEMSKNTLVVWGKIKYGEWCNYVFRELV